MTTVVMARPEDAVQLAGLLGEVDSFYGGDPPSESLEERAGQIRAMFSRSFM